MAKAKKAKPSNRAAPVLPARPWTLIDTALLAALVLLAIFFLYLSWRKWPDPVVDFGRELYLPWRLSQGAVLYRDVYHIYGPLSQYFHSLLFKTAGVGLTTLIAANLTVYATILVLLYYLMREGWGRAAACVSCAVFVAVFSFSHLAGIGNYTYAAPYAHEATHGIALTLLLVLMWRSIVEHFRPWKFFGAGILAGLCVLLKPEFILAAAAVTTGAVALLMQKLRGEPWNRRWAVPALCFVLGGIVPPLAATALFRLWTGVPLSDALQYANNAWITPLRFPAHLRGLEQQYFRGTDNISANLLREVLWGGVAVAIPGSIGWACRRWSRSPDLLYLFAALAAISGIWIFSWVPWNEVGRTIPALLILAGLLELSRMGRARSDARVDAATATRILLWLAAAVLLVRMALNPRVYHYGFYQAALAAIVAIATLLSVVPDRFALVGTARICYQALLIVVILYGGGAVAWDSADRFALQEQPVGTGPDQFYAYASDVEPSGALVEAARRYLTADRSAQTLLVLPEGIMLNYLTRLPSPASIYVFQPAFLTPAERKILMEQLHADPPDRVVFITRDLQEFGVRRFGESPESGREILEFVENNYQPVYRIGGDPLDSNQRGLVISARRGANGTVSAAREHSGSASRPNTR